MTSERIEIHPKVMLGKPVIRGTRVPVELLTSKLRDGITHEDLLDAYPRLNRADIEAVIRHSIDCRSTPPANPFLDPGCNVQTWLTPGYKCVNHH